MADDLEGLNFTINLGDNPKQQDTMSDAYRTRDTTNSSVNQTGDQSSGYSYDRPEESSSFFSGLANIFTGGGGEKSNENTYQSPNAIATPQSMSNSDFNQNE